MSFTNPFRTPRRSSLLLAVFSASLLLVFATAIALAAVVGDSMTRATINSSVAADQSLVLSVVTGRLTDDDMRWNGPSSARVAEIDGLLANLVDGSHGLVRIKVHAPDGTILFSDDPSLRGRQFDVEDDLQEALDGVPSTTVLQSFDGETEDLNGLGLSSALEEYLPIVGSDGKVDSVFEVYRDAGPLLAAVDQSRRNVVAIVLGSAAVLMVLLYLIFRATQRRLDRQTSELLDATRRDALTGLLNHGAIVSDLVDHLEACRREGGSVGIALVDIDNFRAMNETYGHKAGDQTLERVAAILRAELSNASVLGRFGPDEFLVVAPPSCAHDLEPAIGRLRDRLTEVSLQFARSERLPVSVSAGLGFSPSNGLAATELLSAATVALGEAKASGGNGVRVADSALDDLRESQRSSFDVLAGLVVAVDTKDRYTKRHSEDVARYATFIASRMGLDEDLRRTIEICGLLHDVGKIGIPDGILRKPGPLTADEYGIVKQHVALGDAIVRDLPNIDLVRGAIRHHHERWDGAGYLDGLSGEEIPEIARILAVADAFSAMTTTRPYRKALSVREALRRLEDASDSQLDARFVRAFVDGIETASDAPLPGDGRPIHRLWTPEAIVA